MADPDGARTTARPRASSMRRPDVSEIHTDLVALGPAIRPGAVVARMALEDVAPLVARLLGVEFTAAVGVAPLGVLAR